MDRPVGASFVSDIIEVVDEGSRGISSTMSLGMSYAGLGSGGFSIGIFFATAAAAALAVTGSFFAGATLLLLFD